MSPGWDGAYGLFLKGEAPLVWSYTTSQAYHDEHGNHGWTQDGGGRRQFQAVTLEEGQPMQVEGAALIRGAFVGSDPQMLSLARSFLEFLISPEVQQKIPRTNWMYPARDGIALPESFRSLTRPKTIIRLPTRKVEVDLSLSRWAKAVQ